MTDQIQAAGDRLNKPTPAFAVARNAELLGLSIDSHIAWMLNIKEKFGVEIKFPIIAVPNMAVAQAYGMIQPRASDTAAVRAAFLIDPEGVPRAMPENWTPGNPVIVPTLATPRQQWPALAKVMTRCIGISRPAHFDAWAGLRGPPPSTKAKKTATRSPNVTKGDFL